MPTIEELKILQNLPLEMKIARTEKLIKEWVHFHGLQNVFVSFSGGKDSTVLLHIARKIYPELSAVFVDTGLEYPEIRDFVKTFKNVKFLSPAKNFATVISEYGYPVISKAVSHNVGILRRCPDGNVAKNIFNPNKKGPYAMFKWKPLANTDFILSDKCCDIMKKKPIHDYCKNFNCYPITAQLACESKIRESKWLQFGCNAFESVFPVSNPLSFWTEQDILHYICRYTHDLISWRKENTELENVTPICDIYGDVVYNIKTHAYRTTKLHRTGCMFCAFGVHLEKGSTRFQTMQKTHPKLYNYCIQGGKYKNGVWTPSNDFETVGLGLGHVFDVINNIYGKNFIRYK